MCREQIELEHYSVAKKSDMSKIGVVPSLQIQGSHLSENFEALIFPTFLGRVCSHSKKMTELFKAPNSPNFLVFV